MSDRAKPAPLRVWPALFVAPLAFSINLVITYALVNWVCAHQRHGVLHLVEAIFLLIALAGTIQGVRVWRALRAPATSDAGDRSAQRHFLGLTGTLLSALFVLAIAAQWFTALVVPPCLS